MSRVFDCLYSLDTHCETLFLQTSINTASIYYNTSYMEYEKQLK